MLRRRQKTADVAPRPRPPMLDQFSKAVAPTRSIEDPLTVALCKMTTTTVICMIGTTTGTTATSTIIMLDTTTPPVISIATATGAATTSIGKQNL